MINSIYESVDAIRGEKTRTPFDEVQAVRKALLEIREKFAIWAKRKECADGIIALRRGVATPAKLDRIVSECDGYTNDSINNNYNAYKGKLDALVSKVRKLVKARHRIVLQLRERKRLAEKKLTSPLLSEIERLEAQNEKLEAEKRLSEMAEEDIEDIKDIEGIEAPTAKQGLKIFGKTVSSTTLIVIVLVLAFIAYMIFKR